MAAIADDSEVSVDPSAESAPVKQPNMVDPSDLASPYVKTGVDGTANATPWSTPEEPAMSWRALPARGRALAGSVAAMIVLGITMAVIPVPYAVERPGPTFDTLGKSDDKDLIQISGAKTYSSTGQLRLVTVSVSGGPGYPVTFVDVVRAWIDPHEAVVPVEQVYPPGQSKEETEEQSQVQMTSSQEAATVAALEELDYKVPTTLTVASLVKDSASEGVLQKNDVLVAINGKSLEKYSILKSELAKLSGGTEVTISVLRDKKPMDLTVRTGASEDGEAVLGIYISPEFDMPVDVKIGIDNVGGPSAGMIFALGVMDKLTKDDESNGKIIAGTGTMDVDGNVGPIGGIVQKMVGAAEGQTSTRTSSDDAATWFLAPKANCSEVVDNIPEGMTVVAVATLHEAWEAVKAIGRGDGDSLPGCSAE